MNSPKVSRNRVRCPLLLINFFGHFTQALLITIKSFYVHVKNFEKQEIFLQTTCFGSLPLKIGQTMLLSRNWGHLRQFVLSNNHQLSHFWK